MNKEKLFKIIYEYVDRNTINAEELEKEINLLAEDVELSEKKNLFNPDTFEFMGEGVEYWKNLEVYAKENMMDDLVKEKVLLEVESKRLKEDLEVEKKLKGKNLKAFHETQKELNEFVESGWEANGNKLYFKDKKQS